MISQELNRLIGLKQENMKKSSSKKISSKIYNIIDKVLEDTSAVGGPAGMGSVVSSQPSGLAGQTIGPNWASNGGTIGSGDVSIPYNPGGSNRVFQSIKSPVDRSHSSRMDRKRNKKRANLKKLKNLTKNISNFEQAPKGKVMNYNDFLKNDFTTIKK